MCIMFDILLTGDSLSTKCDRSCVLEARWEKGIGESARSIVEEKEETGWGQII